MAAIVACISGEEIYRQWEARRLAGKELGPRQTPFGPSSPVFLLDCPRTGTPVVENPADKDRTMPKMIDGGGQSFYLLPRYGPGLAKTAPSRVNYRANMYALKDLGVQGVLAWGPGGAVTHNIAVGDLVVLSDLIDMTNMRPRTFFENSPLGFLRQFPVFCPALRAAMAELLGGMKLVFHPNGVAAVCEGPRLETPAEVRMLGTMGAEVVTHTFAPEMFLAKELQMCYCAVCYVVNYAETGSKHRPFAAGELFAGLTNKTDIERVSGAVGAMTQIMHNLAQLANDRPATCECAKTMEHNIRTYGLSRDWREWFTKV